MPHTTNILGFTLGTGSPHFGARFAGELLAGLPLFDELEGTRHRIESACHWVHYDAGQTIVDPNDNRRDVFFIVRGRVRVVGGAASGRNVTHADLEAGEIFGELAVLGDQPRTARVWAVEPTLVAVLPPEELLAAVRDDGTFALRLLNRLAHIVKDCGTEIARLC